jgi:hypothetical protein
MTSREEQDKRNKIRGKGTRTGTKRGNKMKEKGPTMD